MSKRIVSRTVLMLLFTCVLTFAFSLQPVRAYSGDTLPRPEYLLEISTDRFVYSPEESMMVTITVVNPTKETVVFRWYWGVPEFGFWVLVKGPISIPPYFEHTAEFNFRIPYLNEESFGNVFYVQLSTTVTETLAADTACWAYLAD